MNTSIKHITTYVQQVKTIVCVVLVISLAGTSCASRKFTALPTQEINKKIRFDVTIVGPAELLYFVYPYPDSHTVHIDWKELRKQNQYKITLTHTNLKDDSIAAYKYVVYAKFDGVHWNISKILRAHRCREGRGNTRWNKNPCL